MNSTVRNIRIKSVATCVPEYKLNILDNTELYKDNRKKLDKVISTTGFYIRHVIPANSSLTVSDLCYYAAEKILENEDKSSISAIIMVTQTPDLIAPATSCLMQSRLGLNESVLTFDVNQGCAGFVYGLLIASRMIDSSNRKVLLLTGNASSKIFGTGENAVKEPPIFGDGGSAVLLEYNEDDSQIFFNVGVDSSNYQALYHKNGGFRNQPTKNMFKEDGSFDYGSYMDGLGVFNFSITKVPESIREILSYAHEDTANIDYFIFHQANKAIITNIAKILDIPIEKVPYETLSKYGNLSVASIPSVLTDMGNIFNNKINKVLMSGFGIGLSWASAYLVLDKPVCYPMIYV